MIWETRVGIQISESGIVVGIGLNILEAEYEEEFYNSFNK
jgi:hypothetical protein